MNRAQSIALVRALSAVSWADGTLDASEENHLISLAYRLGLTADDLRDEVRPLFAHPVPQDAAMEIVGDLVKLTEAELLSYKNFGETSLTEIKALLSKRGLRLGQSPEEIDVLAIEPPPAAAAAAAAAAAPPPPVTVPPGNEALLTRPVSELELSVRARRCLQRLNIVTLGDLLQMSEADLLATRNFGVTSLTEIKARLTEFGLELAVRRAE